MKDRYTIIDHILKDLKEDLEFSSKDKGYIHIINQLSNDLFDLKEELLNDIRLDETIDNLTKRIEIDDLIKDIRIEETPEEESEEPDYYAQNGLSPMSAFKQGLISKEEYIGFCKGNVIKYTVRCGKKDDAISDIDKAINYLIALKEAYF